MMGRKICFDGEIWIIIPKLSQLPLFIWNTDVKNSSLYLEKHLLSAVRILHMGINRRGQTVWTSLLLLFRSFCLVDELNKPGVSFQMLLLVRCTT